MSGMLGRSTDFLLGEDWVRTDGLGVLGFELGGLNVVAPTFCFLACGGSVESWKAVFMLKT